MARSLFQQNNFASGILEPRLLGRYDLDQYYSGLQQADNVFLLPQGGFRQAPGQVFLEDLEAPLLGSYNTRMFEFSVSSTRSYLLVFVENKLRVFRDQEFLLEFNNTTQTAQLYQNAEVENINEAQVDNIIIFVEQYGGFRRLVAPSDGLDDSNIDNWSFDVPELEAPQVDYDDDNSPVPVDEVQLITFSSFTEGDTFKLILEGVTTEEIYYLDIDTNPTGLYTNIQTALENHPLTSGKDILVSGGGTDSALVTFSDSSADNWDLMGGYANFSDSTSASILISGQQDGSSRKEDAWSVLRGWPRVITFYNGRMYLGNLIFRKSSLFGSRSGDLLSFDLGESADDDAIFVTLATDTLNEITNIISGRQLQVFTSGAEFFVPTEIPTPASFEIRAQTNHGSSFVNPVQIDGATLFLERKGKSLREYLFSFQEDSYLANNISVLAQHLIIDPVDMDAQKGTQSDDANYVLIVNSDGTMSVLNTLRSQGIAGFTRRINTNGKYLSVAVVDDVVYVNVEREIEGLRVRYIEYWTFESLLDSSYQNTYETATTSITGLEHLEGETVKVLADGAVLLDNVVLNGEITLERAATTVDIGLWQSPVVRPMPINGLDSRTGNNQARLKSIARTTIRLYETSALQYDGVTIPRRKFAPAINSPLNTPPTAFTGLAGDLETNLGWERDQAPLITQEEPGPITVLNINYEIEAR